MRCVCFGGIGWYVEVGGFGWMSVVMVGIMVNWSLWVWCFNVWSVCGLYGVMFISGWVWWCCGRRKVGLCRGCVSVDVFFPVRVTLLEVWLRCSLFSVLVDWSEAMIVRLVYLSPVSLVAYFVMHLVLLPTSWNPILAHIWQWKKWFSIIDSPECAGYQKMVSGFWLTDGEYSSLQSPILLSPTFVRKIVLALLVLHNFLR